MRQTYKNQLYPYILATNTQKSKLQIQLSQSLQKNEILRYKSNIPHTRPVNLTMLIEEIKEGNRDTHCSQA